MNRTVLRFLIAMSLFAVLVAGCSSGPSGGAGKPTLTAAPAATQELTATPQPTQTPAPTKTPKPTETSTPTPTATLAKATATSEAAVPVPSGGTATGEPTSESATATPKPPASTPGARAGGPMVFMLEGNSGGLPWSAEGYNCQGVYGTWKIHETMKGTTPEGMTMDLVGDLTGEVPADGSEGPLSGSMVIAFSAGPVKGSITADGTGTIAAAGTAESPALRVTLKVATGQAQAGGPGAGLSMPFSGTSDKPEEVPIHSDPNYPECK